MRIRVIIVFLLGVLLFSACEKKPQLPSNKYMEKDSTSEKMMELNALMVAVEQDEITAYIEKSGLKFEESPGGFWYIVNNTGNGMKIEDQNILLVDYQLETVHGDILYTYTGSTARDLKVGRLEKERGFNDALTLLQEGSEAIVIVPSTLAYGILGDRDRIPPRAALVYRINDIKIIQ